MISLLKQQKYGLVMEPIARKYYLNRVKIPSEPNRQGNGFVSKEFPFLVASPDGLVHCTCHHCVSWKSFTGN